MLRLLSLLLLLASAVQGQVLGNFRQINMDGGGWVTGLTQHPSGKLFCRTDVGGIYRSDDRGDNWTYLSGDLTGEASLFVQGLAVSPKDPKILFTACGTSYANNDPSRGIWKSTDGGNSWTHSKKRLNFSGNDDARHGGECLIFHPTQPETVLAGSREDGLWVTHNLGALWEELHPHLFRGKVITTLAISPQFPSQIWVGTEEGLYFSRNKGKKFEKVNDLIVHRIVRTPNGDCFITAGSYHPKKPEETQLIRLTSEDWSSFHPIIQENLWHNYLSAHQEEFGYKPVGRASALGLLRDGSLVTGTFFRNLAISGDDCKSFEILPRKVTGPLPVWQILQEPFKSELQGGWTEVIQDTSDDNTWFATGGYGPARTRNAGQTWEYITQGIGEVVAWKPVFHPSDPSMVALPCADHGLTLVTDGGLSGRTSGTISRHFAWPDDVLTFAHSAVFDGDRLIAFGGEQISLEARVWESVDKGETWTKLPAKGVPIKSGHVFIECIRVMNQPNTVIGLLGGEIGPGKGGIYRSEDGGQTFSQVLLPDEVLGSQAGSEFVWNSRLRSDASGRLYFGLRNKGIYESDDQGRSWQRLDTPGLETLDIFLEAHATKAGHLYGTSESTGLHHFDGQEWGKSPHFTAVKAVSADGARVAVIGKREGDDWFKIYLSSDDGQTFNEVTRKGYRLANAASLTLNPHNERELWIGTTGRSVAVFTVE